VQWPKAEAAGLRPAARGAVCSHAGWYGKSQAQVRIRRGKLEKDSRYEQRISL